MLHPNLFFLFEFLGFAAFAIVLGREIYQRNNKKIFEILSSLVFGMLLEIGNTQLAHTYSYSDNFLVQIGNVPLAIGFGWAVIIYCAMLLSDQYHITWHYRPFMDALTAVFLDLSLDTIAIRLGFWRWAIPLHQEWYGVPFENLVGWILVVLSFSFLVRFIRTLNPKRITTGVLMLLSPVISYAGLIAGFIIFDLIVYLPYQINNWGTLLKYSYGSEIQALYDPQVQLWKLILLVIMIIEMINVIVWAIIKHRKKYLWRFDLTSFTILSGLHVFFFVALFITGVYKEVPYLVFLSVAMFLLHCLLHFLPYLLSPSKVYIFKDLETSLKHKERKVEKLIDKSFR